MYPMRINKYLALKNLASRRGADVLIADKKVFINGKLALLGSKVNETDKVEVRDKNPKKNVYYAYNKPIDIVTHSANKKLENEEQDIKENLKKLKLGDDIFPLGRLDKNSHGLIILTNDGRITENLLSPDKAHEKEYVVKTSNKLRGSFKEKMEKGVDIEGYVTKPCKVIIVNDHSFRVILTEGKKHQIRRMCSALFQEIADLKRIRVMNIKLDKLKPNQFREITGKELEDFLKQVLK